MQDMDMAVGAVYVRKYFTAKDKAEATDMITKIKSAFRSILSNGTTWMDDATKSAALEKLDAMKDNVGYPDMAIDDKKLDEYYENLTMEGLNKSSTYFSWYKRLASYAVSREAYKLLKPSDRFRFPLSPAMADAHYAIDRNVMS
uniref:Peptidase M13 N-terminal domain-containing protein n=1 Tax=Romanomermis culicivorax TaxID=13658 RepID=A0A915JE92_ROMCU